MKKSFLAMAALAAIGDIGLASARQSCDEAHGHERRISGNLADNTTATYTGGAGDGTQHRAQGQIVLGATAITTTDSLLVVTGFKPRKVRFWNTTDRVTLEWYEGMADDSALKIAAAGTQTLEVTGGNGGITVYDRGFRVKQNATLAAVLASKTLHWEAVA